MKKPTPFLGERTKIFPMSAPYRIETPCPVEWEGMKIVQHGRYCEHCSKDVVDFSEWSREAIIRYLLERPEGSVCGRLRKDQLDARTFDPYVVIEGLSERQKKSGLPIHILTLASLLMLGCENGSEKDPSTEKEVPSELASLSERSVPSRPEPKKVKGKETSDTVSNPLCVEKGMVMGEMVAIDDSSSKFMGLDEPPRFPGGHDSLMAFFQREIKYPKWEKKKGIEGTVYVRIQVDSSGAVENPEILRSVPKSRNFDVMVRKALRRMPEWIPALRDGEKVRAPVTLPIRFHLPTNKDSAKDTLDQGVRVKDPEKKDTSLKRGEKDPIGEKEEPDTNKREKGKKDLGGTKDPGFEAKLFPNPIRAEAATLELDKSDEWGYLLYDERGRIQKRGNFSGDRTRMSFSAFENGIYLLKVFPTSEREKARTIELILQK